MRQKELYAAPETEVLELRLENAVLTISGGEASGQNVTWDLDE